MFQLSAMDGHSKREALEIFDMNQKNVIACYCNKNIDHFIGGHILFWTKRTHLRNKGEKTPFRKIVILAKLLLCETSSSTVDKMRGDQTLEKY